MKTPETIHYAITPSTLGMLLAATSAKGLVALLPGATAEELIRDLQERFPAAILAKGDELLEKTARDLARFIENPAATPGLTLDLRGTDFQRRVWNALLKIPAGKTASYAKLAADIGMPRASRAVAGACAANALAVVVPCHRVIRGDGALSGYRWGVARKRKLLEKEGAQTPAGG